jgi:Metallo-beta-lactamase superfamily
MIEIVPLKALQHHHPDHVGGVPELLRRAAVPVYGPRNEPIATLTHPVTEGDAVAIPELGIELSVLDIPGHTRAHIAYYGAISRTPSLHRIGEQVPRRAHRRSRTRVRRGPGNEEQVLG